MAATLLIYHMEENRRQILQGLCRSMGIRPVTVDEDSCRVPIGLLSGSVPLSTLAAGASRHVTAGSGQSNPKGSPASDTEQSNPKGSPASDTGQSNPKGSPASDTEQNTTDADVQMQEEMIVMCGFTKPQFDNLLEMLKMAGLQIGLKAVETPVNQMWNGEVLQAELARERAAFEQRVQEAKKNQTNHMVMASRTGNSGIRKGRVRKRGAGITAGRQTTVDRLTREDIEELAQKAVKVIPERVAHFAPMVGVNYGRITIRNQRSRWGSCSAKGNLNFNCLLMLAPPEVLDSVVVHELCHRLEMNHSKKFYEHVLRVYPDYYKEHAWLKEHGPELMRRMTG